MIFAVLAILGILCCLELHNMVPVAIPAGVRDHTSAVTLVGILVGERMSLLLGASGHLNGVGVIWNTGWCTLLETLILL